MSLPVLTSEQMKAWESASWAVKVSVSAVISQVGERLSSRLKALVPAGQRVLLLAGKGHNGDDVRAMVLHLSSVETEVVNVHDPVSAMARVRSGLARSPAWIVDGLFGIGLHGPLSPPWCQLIDAVNASGLPVFSVDIPSGIHADSGEPAGAAIVARITVAVGVPKIGLFRRPALPYVGRLEVATGIGLTPGFQPPVTEGCDSALGWTQSSDFQGLVPVRAVDAHKGDFGHLVIVAGSLGFHGAAVLAARAALRARPGLVTVVTSPEVYHPVASHLTSVMVVPWRESLEILSRASAVLVGPGLAGPEVPDWLRIAVRDGWLKSTKPWIADASALDWLKGLSPSSDALRVWTPHPGEAGRLLDRTADEVQADRLKSARRLSQGIWTVLKGHQTLVCSPDGRIQINPSGNPGLAQGGSGDVLAGFLGGCLAQRPLADVPDRAIRFAVWDHGVAADRLEGVQRPWTPDDLIGELGLPLNAHPADPLHPNSRAH